MQKINIYVLTFNIYVDIIGNVKSGPEKGPDRGRSNVLSEESKSGVTPKTHQPNRIVKNMVQKGTNQTKTKQSNPNEIIAEKEGKKQ